MLNLILGMIQFYNKNLIFKSNNFLNFLIGSIIMNI